MRACGIALAAQIGRTRLLLCMGLFSRFWGVTLSQRRIAVSALIEPPIFTQVPVASTMVKPRP